MKDQYLELEVRLLILRHGRQRVISTLARLSGQTAEQLEAQLNAVEQKLTPDRRSKPSPSLTEVVASVTEDRPEIAESLRSVARSFENRTFLPNLRDVQRFLERIGGSSVSLKSRAAAGAVLIRELSKLPQEEVLRLIEKIGNAGESDYSLLSRAIMGSRPRGPGEQE